MCGIVGVLTAITRSRPILVEALKRLEYRGYDSAGIATVHDGVLDAPSRGRQAASICPTLLVHEPLRARRASATPAGPPMARPPKRTRTRIAGPVGVVHNGIIENFRDLRANCRQGPQSSTDTDTETIALLCESFLEQGRPR
jgi:glucosamine--fructose-6-phosphate aminotransferase (isomerizing)